VTFRDGDYVWRKLACPDCGYVAQRKVFVQHDGTLRFAPPRCSICDLERSARVHEGTARRFRVRIAEMRAKRAAIVAKRAAKFCTVCTPGHGEPGTKCERHGKLIAEMSDGQ